MHCLYVFVASAAGITMHAKAAALVQGEMPREFFAIVVVFVVCAGLDSVLALLEAILVGGW